MNVVLDTSAILAMLWAEPGASRVDDVIEQAVVSSVNHAELIAKLVDRGASADQVEEVLAALNLMVAEFDVGQAGIAGALRRETRAKGLSLGDRCCLALARTEGLPVLTADKVWAELNLGIEVEVIR